jgi:hypothetical protein
MQGRNKKLHENQHLGGRAGSNPAAQKRVFGARHPIRRCGRWGSGGAAAAFELGMGE